MAYNTYVRSRPIHPTMGAPDSTVREAWERMVAVSAGQVDEQMSTGTTSTPIDPKNAPIVPVCLPRNMAIPSHKVVKPRRRDDAAGGIPLKTTGRYFFDDMIPFDVFSETVPFAEAISALRKKARNA